MDKKGQGLNITTIIILVLAVLVLLVVAVAYTGGWSKLWKRITGVEETSKALEKSVAIQQCNLQYSLGDKNSFCNEKIKVKIGNEEKTLTCLELGNGASWKDGGFSMTEEEAKNFCS